MATAKTPKSATPANVTPDNSVEPVAQAVTAAAPEPEITPPASKPAGKAVSKVVIHQAKDEAGLVPNVDALIDFNKANAEAVIAASHHLAVGVQEITHDLIDWSQALMNKNIMTTQKISSVTSVDEALSLSQTAMQDTIQALVDESNRLTSLSTKLFEQSMAPLQTRIQAAMESLGRFAA